MKKLTYVQKICLVIISLILLVVIVYSFKSDYNSFLSASLITIIGTILVLYVSFYLTQYMTDRREKVRHIEKLLFDISDMINSNDLIGNSDDEKKRIAMIMQRRIANKINILKSYELKGQAGENVEKLNKDFKHLRELYSEYFNKSTYFTEQNMMEINNYIEKIDAECDFICRELL